MGTFVGGQILGDGRKDTERQLYNYISVFIVSVCLQLGALFWVLFVINEKKNKLSEVSIVRREVFEASSAESINSDVIIEQPEDRLRIAKFLEHLKQLFDLNNVRDILYTCIKPRPNNARAQIWLLFLSIVCVLLSYLGGMLILWQYVEKLFSWSAKYYSNVNSLVSVFTILSLAIIIPVFVKKLKVRDMLLGMN